MNKLNKILLIVAVLLIIAFSFHIIKPYDTVRNTTDFQGGRGIGFGSSDGTHSPLSHEQGESSQVGTTSYQDFFGTGSGGESSYGDFFDSGSDSGSDSGGDGGDSGGDSGGDGGDGGD
jgi:hypothetical protein